MTVGQGKDRPVPGRTRQQNDKAIKFIWGTKNIGSTKNSEASGLTQALEWVFLSGNEDLL